MEHAGEHTFGSPSALGRLQSFRRVCAAEKIQGAGIGYEQKDPIPVITETIQMKLGEDDGANGNG